MNPALSANAQGSDYYFGTLGTRDDGTLAFRESNEPAGHTNTMGILTRLYTDKAINFLKNKRDRNRLFGPYVAHTMMHTIIDVSSRFRGRSPTASADSLDPNTANHVSLRKRRTAMAGVIVFAVLLTQTDESLAQRDGTDQRNLRPLVFVITGESNSGGIGENSDASPKERAPRSCVQIMNLTDGRFRFEDMHLGANNLRGHFRLDDFYASCHGFENELANAVDGSKFPGHKQVYLIKTGQGGSRISEWSEQNESGFWKKFLQRVEAGKRQLPDNSQWVVWFSLGINDAIAGTPIPKWKEDVRVHLMRIKAQLPGAIIVMTQFQSMGYPQLNVAIAEIAGNQADVFTVDSTGAALRDRNHWDYAGLKTVAQRMVEVTRKAVAKAQEEATR